MTLIGFMVISVGILWAVIGNLVGFGAADAGHSDALVIFGIVILLIAIAFAASKGNSEVGD